MISDTHVGDSHADLSALRKLVKEISEDPSAYVILNGDLMNNATKTSKSDVYSELMNPDAQMDMVVDIFNPIKHKIIAMTAGNHEKRSAKGDGVDISKQIAIRLGVPYNRIGFMIFLRFGTMSNYETKSKNKRMVLYRIMVYHGSRGGRSVGSKMEALYQMRGIANADIYIHSHTHLAGAFKNGFLETDDRNSTVSNVQKMFVNTTAWLKYGGYGLEGEYPPSAIAHPIIILSGKKRDMKTIV